MGDGLSTKDAGPFFKCGVSYVGIFALQETFGLLSGQPSLRHFELPHLPPVPHLEREENPTGKEGKQPGTGQRQLT